MVVAQNRMIFGAYCHESELASHPFRAAAQPAQATTFDPTQKGEEFTSSKEMFDGSGLSEAARLFKGGVVGAGAGGAGLAAGAYAIGNSFGHPVAASIVGGVIGVVAGGIGGVLATDKFNLFK
jgi:hypothetical protein